MYVPKIASRMQGLEWLDVLGKGKHLEGDLTHLRKASAMIIEPHSSGTHRLAYMCVWQRLCVTVLMHLSAAPVCHAGGLHFEHPDGSDEQAACVMSAGTSLVVDGEAIPYKRVYVEVHPSLCNAIVA